jgi:glutathione S-transferase
MASGTLYVVPGSHPSMSGRLMLAHKGISYRRVDLIAGLHKPILRVLGFGDTTVPALRLEGRRIQGTLNISRALDEVGPDPPLFPADPSRRAAVEEAERWGEAVLQPVPRRLTWWALQKDRSGIRSFVEGARLGVPLGIAARTAAPIIWAEVKINHASDEAVRADLAALPTLLDQVDAWLAEGLLGSEPPTAADYQIATSVRLLTCFADFDGLFAGRPCCVWGHGLVPDFPGHVPPVFPETWLPAAA